MLSALTPIAVTKSYPKGKILFMEGDEARGFWWIKTGSVRLYSLGESGREVEIHRCETGQIVGAAFALAHSRFPHFGEVTAVAELVFYDTRKAMPLIVQTPALSAFFLKVLAGKCSELTSRITALQMQTVRDRLLYYLGESCPTNGACSFRLPMAKKELALQLNTTPETLSRTMAQLELDGVLKIEKRQVTLVECLRKERCRGRTF